MNKILVTGATGFIGGALVEYLADRGIPFVAAVRSSNCSPLAPRVKLIQTGEILPDTEWSQALLGVNVVIHLAAVTSAPNEKSIDSLSHLRRVNTASALNLAQQAAFSGVGRFIFLSSIKVNGEFTPEGQPFRAGETNIPKDPYGLSKYEAEQGLHEIAKQTGMELVVIRPPIVYGPNVKGNFLQMMSWVSKGVPLPLGAIHSQRSLVALDNLIDLISVCVEHPAAAGETFLVSDDEDVTTTQLLKKMGKALGKPARLVAIPQGVLEVFLSTLGKQAITQRLCTSLQVDISKTKSLLGWQPFVSMDEAMDKTAKAWLKQQG